MIESGRTSLFEWRAIRNTWPAWANLRLPLWFVYDRKPNVPPEYQPCDDPNGALAFSTTENLLAFLNARQGGTWNLKMVCEAKGLFDIVAELHKRTGIQVCLDPEPDGSEGERVTLAELLELSDSLRKR